MNTALKNILENFFGYESALATEIIWKERSGEVQKIVDLDFPSAKVITIGDKSWSSSHLCTTAFVQIGEEVKKDKVIGLGKGRIIHNTKKVIGYPFVDDVERAEFLLELIKRWAGHSITFFCEGALQHFDWNSWKSSPKEHRISDPLGFKNPSECYSCRVTYEILAAILGSDYGRFPFLVYKGDRCYRLDLEKLEIFIEGGNEAVINEEKKIKEKLKRDKLQRIKREVTEALANAEISDAAHEYLIECQLGDKHWNGIRVISSEHVLIYGERSNFGTRGGVGKYCWLCLWHNGKEQMQEWQWRDRYSPSEDHPELYIRSLGEVVVSDDMIRVELLNQYGSRVAEFHL